MPIRIFRAMRFSALAAFLLLAACGPGAGVRPEPAAPSTPQALMAEGDAALERGDLPKAAAAYRRAAEASDDETVAEQATRMASDNLQLGEAARAAERWLALNPTSEQAHRFAGVVALKQHRLDKAEAEFAPLIQSVYISPAAGFLALLPVISAEGLPTDVTELFRRLSGHWPKVAEGHYALGTSALRSENFAVAVAAAGRAVELAPYWTPARLLLARALIASGQEAPGLAMARDLVMAPESDISTHLEYALLLASTGHEEEARALLTPYATGHTVIPGAVRTLGALDLDAGRLEEAQHQFEVLLATGAQSNEALYFLGLTAERRHDTASAVRDYSRVTSGAYALAAQERVAQIRASVSGLAAGLQYLDEYGQTQAQLGAEMVMARSTLASNFKDEKKALEILNAGLTRYPDSIDLRMARVMLDERTGREDRAIRDLRDLLRERPGDVMVMNALGYTLADHNRQLGEARSLIERALAQSPDSAAILDSMGWVLVRQGQPQAALPYLQRASELGKDPEIDLHLGEARWASGDQAGARRTWAAALERHPGDKSLQDRLRRAGP
ncbi:MAG TPA: tetratricopeptide repeat protein [Steroidobacteraceae bacterium]|nr:tetratricopeptide repeat protein [Steroidobacteraceae bacterium]